MLNYSRERIFCLRETRIQPSILTRFSGELVTLHSLYQLLCPDVPAVEEPPGTGEGPQPHFPASAPHLDHVHNLLRFSRLVPLAVVVFPAVLDPRGVDIKEQQHLIFSATAQDSLVLVRQINDVGTENRQLLWGLEDGPNGELSPVDPVIVARVIRKLVLQDHLVKE